MNSEERTLIDGLFSRLHDTERQSCARDAEADAHIAEHVSRQPAAPYYMAQTILIQEEALKRQDQRSRNCRRNWPIGSSNGRAAAAFCPGCSAQAHVRRSRSRARDRQAGVKRVFPRGRPPAIRASSSRLRCQGRAVVSCVGQCRPLQVSRAA